jgi:hypothetical protein
MADPPIRTDPRLGCSCSTAGAMPPEVAIVELQELNGLLLLSSSPSLFRRANWTQSSVAEIFLKFLLII